MDLSGILAIGGYPGLFKMVSQMKSGLVVESILDGKRMPAYSTQKILALEDISIYTDEDDVPLADVFGLLFKKTGGKAGPNHKKASIQELSDFLASVLPNYDKNRVYNSDLKKLFQWFNLLTEKGLLKEKEEAKAEKPAKKKAPAKAEKEEKAAKPKAKSEPKGKKGSTKKVKNKLRMQKEAVIPTRPVRRYLAEEFRVDSWDTLQPLFDDLLNRTISSVAELEEWMKDLSEVEAVLSEETAWRYIRMNIDTTNEEYAKAFDFMVTEIDPKAAPYSDKFNKKLLESPFYEELDTEKYSIFLRSLKMQVKLYREESIPLFTTLQQAQQKYGLITGAMSIEHDGQKLTLQMAQSFLKDTDRELRKAIYEKVNAARLEKTQELNQLFTELVSLRDKIAKQADYANYRDYKLDALGRFDYTAQDCLTFHSAIEAECVPLNNKVDIARKEALGLDTLKPFDADVDPTGKAGLKPFKDEKELINLSIEAFGKIRPYYGECLETMDAMGHLDLGSRLGKAPGGFNYPLYEIGVPFIFMNSVGSLRDLITMVHEGGHAVHSFLSKDLEITGFKHLPSEVAELASMSMELISIDQWDVFFDNETDLNRAKKEHLEKIMATLPWIATIDAFQHWVYENPTHTEAERSENWLRISNRFGGKVVDWTGYEDVKKFQWQKQLHLYEVPFYYIEYGIAQLGAIAVWRNYRENPEKALDQYEAALKLGYTKPIGEIYAAAGIEFNFTQDYVHELMGFVWSEYSKL